MIPTLTIPMLSLPHLKMDRLLDAPLSMKTREYNVNPALYRIIENKREEDAPIENVSTDEYVDIFNELPTPKPVRLMNSGKEDKDYIIKTSGAIMKSGETRPESSWEKRKLRARRKALEERNSDG